MDDAVASIAMETEARHLPISIFQLIYRPQCMPIGHLSIRPVSFLERILDLTLYLTHALFHQVTNKSLSAFRHNFLVLLPQLLDYGILTAHRQLSGAQTVITSW